jgi:hypothetical protein
MRYGLESALPINAFSPRGRGPFAYGMTLEGGGGGFDPFQAVGDALASIDPGPAIGQIGVEIDQGVNSAIPGGWVTVGAIALAATGVYFAPEIFAALGAESAAAGAGAISSEAGQAAFFNALAAGGTGAEATAAGLAAQTAAGAGAAGYGTSELANQLGNTVYSNALANGATVAEANAAADAATQTYLATGYQGAAGTGNLVPGVTGEIGANIGTGASSGFGLNPALPATGAAGVGGGISAALPEGAVLGTGLNGGEIGISYVAGPNGMVATDLLGNPIVANSINFGGFPADMGVTPSTITDSAKKAYDTYKQIKTASNVLNAVTLGGITGKAGSSLYESPGLDLSGTTTNGKKSPLDLTADLTQGNTDFNLGPAAAATAPVVQAALPSYAPTQYGMAPGTFAAGGTTTNTQSIAFDKAMSQKFGDLSSDITKGNLNFHLPGYEKVRIFAEGGEVEHNPQFFSEGGLGSLENRYVTGEGNGTSDEVPAMLANGEFVIPADVVSGLGNGSNDSGAKILDEFLATLRSHKQKHDAKHLPPDSKGPLAYLLEAKKRAKA